MRTEEKIARKIKNLQGVNFLRKYKADEEELLKDELLRSNGNVTFNWPLNAHWILEKLSYLLKILKNPKIIKA